MPIKICLSLRRIFPLAEGLHVERVSVIPGPFSHVLRIVSYLVQSPRRVIRIRGTGSAGNGKGRGFCSYPDAGRRCRRNHTVIMYLTPNQTCVSGALRVTVATLHARVVRDELLMSRSAVPRSLEACYARFRRVNMSRQVERMPLSS